MKREKFITEDNRPVMTYHSYFKWRNQFNESVCDLKIYSYGRVRLAVAVEIPANRGMSITNGAEALWAEVTKKFGECIYLETHDGEWFDQVEINNGKASWNHIGVWDMVLMDF